MNFVFDPPSVVSLPVLRGGRFPVRRIFCIGKNYADHVKEMGGDPKSDPPVFFTKPADAVVESGAEFPFPQATENLHYEGELVVALGAKGQGLASVDEAESLIYGYAAGCDLTRRDLQADAKKRGGPWDTAKGFDHSAPVGEIVPAKVAGAFLSEKLVTTLNGNVCQDEPLSSMIWSVPEIIIELSRLFELKAGDLIFTGTPAGVGKAQAGDRIEVHIGSLPACTFTLR